jgi:hypothetical protein
MHRNLRMLFGGILGLTVFTQVARAQDVQIEQTIQAQLDAMAADDFLRAYDYASPNIRQLFGPVENFEAMVKRGYPMVWQHQAVRMLELRSVAGNLWQRVLVTDLQGRGFLLDYMMVETPDGWQINAVQLLPQQELGA